MDKISFGSTFRFPITQAGINPAKKEKLRTFVLQYPNHLISSSNTGSCRISVPEADDDKLVSGLKQLGYKIYQKFNAHNVDKSEIDEFIKASMNEGEYAIKGKNQKIKSRDNHRHHK